MNREIFIPYLIFLTTVVGSFYVLAKNEAGFYLVSLGFLAFSVFFLVGIISLILKKGQQRNAILCITELFGLAGISLLNFCKIYLVLFLGIHKLYLFFCLLIVASTIIRVFDTLRAMKDGSTTSAYVKLNLYGLLTLCLLSDMYSKIANAQLTYLNLAILIAMTASLFFVATLVVRERVATKSNKDYLSLDINKSFWLLFGYFFIIGNSLMITFGYADKVDFKRRPKDYVELFYQAESGAETPVNGKYRFQLYEDGRKQFIKRYWRK